MPDTNDRSRSDLPRSLTQNPAPVVADSQEYKDQIRAQVDLILEDFFEKHTASNYISQTTGPYYTLQFQAIAERLAQFVIEAQEVAIDAGFEFTRSEFLWQILGMLVFPDTSEGMPRIPGDVSYRTFLHTMVDLLLRGATSEVQRLGVVALTNALVTVIEKHNAGKDDPGTYWDRKFQHEFEVNVEDKGVWISTDTGETIEGDYGTGFPRDSFLGEDTVPVLKANVDLVMRALKAGSELFEYRHLFRESLGEVSDNVSLDASVYHYDDFRRFCVGAKEIQSENGETLSDRTLFSDVTLDFRSVREGAILEILDGLNAGPSNGGQNPNRNGIYKVVEKLRLPVGADSTARSYTTTPTLLSGDLIVEDGGILYDSSQDWSNAVEGEVVEISAGPNAGKYRLSTLLGSNGGPVGDVPSGSNVTRARVAVSLVRVDQRMPFQVTGQTYTVQVDRLGVREPLEIVGEDSSALFYL